MKTRIDCAISFGRDGNSREYEAYGWSLPEDGFTWTDGFFAGLVLPAPVARFGFFVELFFASHRFNGGDGTQGVAVCVNGQEIGHSTASDRVRLAWLARPLASTDRKLIITLRLPDAKLPENRHDTRLLGIAVTELRILTLVEPVAAFERRAAALPVALESKAAFALSQRITGISPDQLALNYESLGVKCDAGFFQRLSGAEPLGLLRFSGILLYSLVKSIDDGFEDLGNKAYIDPKPEETNTQDWIIYERHHLLRYHTWVKITDATIEEMKTRESKRLIFLRRKFYEDLEGGDKIFIHAHNRFISDAEILPLFLAVRRHGNASLLCITPADEIHPPGLVEEVYDGLMRGYMSDFTGPGVELCLSNWISVCTSAFMLKEGK